MELLLCLSGVNPEPAPVPSLPSERTTPILAAIGQENIKVIELLVEQSGFDLTRCFRGDTYYEIARGRRGPMWEEEEEERTLKKRLRRNDKNAQERCQKEISVYVARGIEKRKGTGRWSETDRLRSYRYCCVLA
ncbi:hypothetical protein BKA67DRAFT_565183 [Truncatella angustata]|uniref:KRIT1 ARM-repeats domain-containing protein n=1 Tax=Truncatella angustata TaxID=152316 RepID=A0A9P8ULS5_9PEZI|nr:uncharacterized protein BKA67DRAFT_565183 [Truncatella angustata]KAH6654444.1 hypothetical protein BKA67DRAFT_565183 [Truncatella angustata]